MSKSSNTFEPIGFSKYLESTGNYRVCDDDIYQWTGTHWLALKQRDTERMSLKWIEDYNAGVVKSSNARQACETARLSLPELCEATPKAIIPALNGYVHLDATGVSLQPHDPELGLRYVINCNYTPSTPTPAAFEAFLNRVLPDIDIRARVQEYIGYTLLPDAPHQVAQFWIGPGANGKGVLANIVQALHHRVAAVNLDSLGGFSMTEAVNASLIYCDETPRKPMDDVMFKTMTASESVTIQRKYRDPLTTKLRGKWLVLGNHLPEINDHTEGFWRRLDIVPFDVTIPPAERDPLLAQHIINHELDGVLNWAVEGALRLLARGKFDPVRPAAMVTSLNVAKVEANSILYWWQDTEQSIKASADTKREHVYQTYTRWCGSNGLRSVPVTKFWKTLQTYVPDVMHERTVLPCGKRPHVCNIALNRY